MDLSRISSIHKSIYTWKSAQTRILDLEKRAEFNSLIEQLQSSIYQAWNSQAVAIDLDQKIETLCSQIDCLYDESRLLANQ